MKELEIKKSDKLEVRAEAPKEYQRVLIGTLKPKRNQILFSFNVKTGELKRATFVKKDVNYIDAMRGVISAKKEVNVEEDCIYFPALNEKNARKKLGI